MKSKEHMVHFRKYGFNLIIAWTCVIAAILSFIISEYHKDTINEATREAKDYHGLNLHYRRWGSESGGLYASIDKISPNPYLTIPGRDVTTTSGKSLTLINPAYMTRLVFENIRKDSKYPIINRLVSLKPLNPGNVANEWESETLRLFDKKEIVERSQVISIENRPYLQYMAAFITDKSCLKCHADQGYKVGDVRGGMSIAIPLTDYLAIQSKRKQSLATGFALLWFLGTVGIAASSKRRHDYETELLEEKSSLREHAKLLEDEVVERQQIQEQLEEQTFKLEEEIAERQIVQEQLEEQASMLEEETSKHRQSVIDLQKTEHFLNAIIESEPECVKLLDIGGNLLMMNRAGLEMIDAESFDSVQGQCIYPLVNEPFRNAFITSVNEVFQGGSRSLEFEISGLKGRTLWMHSLIVPFRDENDTIVACLAMTRNITNLKHLEEARRTSEDRFRGIAESLADWIWELDADGRYIFSSESSEQAIGYSPAEIIGKTVYEFIDPQDIDRVKTVFHEHAEHKSPIKNLENWKTAKDGRRVCMMTNGVPILDADRVLIGYRGVDSDVTEQRTLERQTLQQQKLESIGLLAGGIAHDFNNLLVPIFGYAEMINSRHSSDEKTSVYSATILKAAEKAKDLVSRLLSFSRKQIFLVEKLDLNEIITSFMVILQRTIRENIEIKLHLSSEPCLVNADRTQIEQALLNLAVNAQDAISSTGILTIETGHLLFDQEYCRLHPGVHQGRHVMIAFSDTGSGIDEATLPYIFDPFFTTKPTGQGTGLGLSTTFGVVKQHNGTIDVDSRKGSGTTFKLYFPEITGNNLLQEDSGVLEKSDQKTGTILVVEDNTMVLQMIREILEGNGHRVITSEEPHQALEMVHSCTGTIDLLISDVVMPQMNGPELYEKIIEHIPGLRVLFMSGYAGVVTARNGHLEEEVNFISKPFTTEAFMRKVSESMSV
ncbi:MAG: PAS domain S-box protein [Desulfuromonadaceae bacterium]|nr:PAS domain S-box protein [Desulfuromonadaceae bacterium]